MLEKIKNFLVMNFLISFFSSLFAGLVIGFFSGRAYEKDIWEQTFKNAPLEYAEYLGKMISEMHQATDINEIIQNAQTVVSIQNDFKKSLLVLGDFLNSDIDRLDELLKEYHNLMRTYRFEPPPEIQNRKIQEIKDMVIVIHKKWPTKEPQIKDHIAKILVDLLRPRFKIR